MNLKANEKVSSLSSANLSSRSFKRIPSKSRDNPNIKWNLITAYRLKQFSQSTFSINTKKMGLEAFREKITKRRLSR